MSSRSSWPTVLSCTVLIVASGCGQPGTVLDDRPPLSSFVELDHVYIYAPAQSTERAVVEAFEEAGFHVSDYRSEFPDGVVGRYVVFHNAYIEVLWHDGNLSADGPTRSRAAWESTQASPFGVGLRRRPGAPSDGPLPSPLLASESEALESGIRPLGAANDTMAPSMFVVPDGMAHVGFEALLSGESTLTPEARAREIDDRTHPLGARELTRARLVAGPQGQSEATQALTEAEIVRIDVGAEPLMELQFDGGDRTRDLRPVLPLVIHY